MMLEFEYTHTHITVIFKNPPSIKTQAQLYYILTKNTLFLMISILKYTILPISGTIGRETLTYPESFFIKFSVKGPRKTVPI